MDILATLEAARKRFINKQESTDIGTLKGLKEIIRKKQEEANDSKTNSRQAPN